jgi:hypothetical protein
VTRNTLHFSKGVYATALASPTAFRQNAFDLRDLVGRRPVVMKLPLTPAQCRAISRFCPVRTIKFRLTRR